MRCKNARIDLVPLLQGRLPQPVAMEVVLHVAACPECRKDLERTKEMWARLGRDAPPVPEFDAQRGLAALRTRLAAEPEPTRPVWKWWKLALPATAAVAAAAAVTIATRPPATDPGAGSAQGPPTPASDARGSTAATLAEMLDDLELFENLEAFAEEETVAAVAGMSEEDLDSLLEEVDG
jgi:anti-sigma factor RsiW